MKNYFYYKQLKLHSHYLVPPYHQEARRIRVLLPKEYDQNPHAHYPVIYMHDGQNVFYSKESFSGHSWKVIPHLKHKTTKAYIVVGIDNDGASRLDEYGPWPYDESEDGGLGFEYAKWVTEVVKPFIDETYRTLSNKENTIVVGSSLGGLMSAVMGAMYPDVYGVLGVFSLASWVSETSFLNFIETHPLSQDTRVYLQVGTNEGNKTDTLFTSRNVNQEYIDSTLAYYNKLVKKGLSVDQIWLRILDGETHSEKYWAKHFREFLNFI